MAKISINNLTYFYPETQAAALNDINLNINPSEFVLLIGRSGSGKSTLLRSIASIVPNFYRGKLEGQILIDEININKLSAREIAEKIALFFQEPEHQIIKHKVENEIAFGLENLGVRREIMQQRIAEVSNALNMVNYLKENIHELSGGMKQKVVLASTLVRQPDILLLDEPISQLDPVAARDLLDVIRLLHEELGITIIIAEHRLENLLSLADRVVVMERGHIIFNGQVEDYLRWTKRSNYQLVPDIPKLFTSADFPNIPLNVKQGRTIIHNLNFTSPQPLPRVIAKKQDVKPTLTLENVTYKYAENSVGIKNISLDFFPGQTTAIIGHNGAGKSTLLKTITGILRPSKGRVWLQNKDSKNNSTPPRISYIPQNPDDFLYLPTVEEELTYNLEAEDSAARVNNLLENFNLSKYRYVNPQDLSLGEKQLVVLAASLIHQPQIICLDEPTRGLDYAWKSDLGRILEKIRQAGTTIIIVSNDMEFVAKYSDEIVIISRGQIVRRGSKAEILAESTFYAPQVNRLFKNIDPGIFTFDEALNFLKTHKYNELHLPISGEGR